MEDAVDTLSQTGAAVLKMVHTHEGAAAVCMLLAYGTARDRKRLVKAMKGFVKETALNEWGHSVVCTALTHVDDTSMMSKTIVAELKVGGVQGISAGLRVALQIACWSYQQSLFCHAGWMC